MTAKVKKPPIHAVIGINKFTDGVLGPILDSTLKGLTANASVYSRLPVDLTTYGNAIAAYKAAIPLARDGSKTAIAQKNKLKEAVIKMYKELAHYVEANCNDDMPTFLLSGFQAKPSSKTLTPPASESIRKVTQGKKSGEVDVTPMRYKDAKSFDLRWAPVPAGGAPTNWANRAIASIKPPTTISGLTPGTTYAFQVRALLNTGYTDWSDSVTLMCT